VTDIRSLYGTTVVELSASLVEQRALLAERFESSSALAEFSVRGLAGHLCRAMTSVETYLDQGPPAPGSQGDVLSAAEYYARVIPEDRDLDSDFNRAIRQRGLEAAPGTSDDLIFEWAETAAGLITRLEHEPKDRLVQVYGGLVMTLDEYLVTRLVELVVHADDLAASLGSPPPALPPAATGLVIATLVEVARIRHGDAATVRALTRRERDAVDALRVL
jgi:uncharacterized protein (TIGR03083 family)